MADFSITITNSVRVFGIEESTKWGQTAGTMTWGTSLWGQGFTVICQPVILITNSITPTWEYAGNYFSKLFNAGSVSPTFEMSSEVLKNGVWSYVFASDTTEAEGRDFPTWSSGSASSVSFTCAAGGSTTWS